MTAASFFFYLLAALAVASAIGVVANVRNTVAAAMSLVVTMISLAGIFLLLDAYLISVIQIMVYAGAIVVLFLFVVMLLNLAQVPLSRPRLRLLKAAAIAVGLAMLAGFLTLLPGALPAMHELPAGFGSYERVGRALFSDYLLPFEATSLLLLAAIVGAVVLAKRRLD